MVKLASVRLRVALFVAGGALVGCNAPDDKPEAVTQVKSPLLATLFSPSVAYATGATTEAVAVGDLNGDGRMDVAVTASTSAQPANQRTLNVFLQAADGTLQPLVRYSLGGAWPRSVDIGDVNGDGRADVVIGNEFGAASAVQVLLQNASGTLDPLVSYPTLNANHVKVGDFNGDGRMDVAGAGTGAVDVFLQTDTGTLALPVTYQVPQGGSGLAAGDVNGDTRTNLVVNPGVSVLLQNADGTMAAPVTYSLGTGIVPSAIAVGDSNSDGRADVVASYGGSRPNSFIARMLQNGQGTLSPAVSYVSWDNPGPMVVADVDADGRRDALVLHNWMGEFGVYRQTESGGFKPEEKYHILGGDSYRPQGLAVGDINGDSLPDVVIADINWGLVVLRHINDPEPTVTLTAPAPGTYFGNVPMTVTWTASADAVGFALYVSFDAGANYNSIQGCNMLAAAARSCTWTPSLPATGMRLRVNTWDAASNTGFSEITINIATATLTVTGPPGLPLPVGAPTTITWTSNLPASTTMRVEITRNSGTSWETLATDAPNTGSFPWTVTGPTTPLARVRVTSNGPVIATSLGATFPIVTPSLTVTAPAAGATVLVGDLMTVNWTSQNLPFGTTVRVELSRDGGASYELLISPVNNFGLVTISNVAGPATTNAIVRVSANGSIPASGTSGVFTIANPSLTVTGPGGGTSFVGTTLPITWASNLPPSATMRVDVSRDGGGTFATVAASVPNSGSFAWTVTGPDTAAARVRVSTNGWPFVSGQSGNFAIVTAAVTVTGSPRGRDAVRGDRAGDRLGEQLAGQRDGAHRAQSRRRRLVRGAGRRAQHRQLRLGRRRPRHRRRARARHRQRRRDRKRHERRVRDRHTGAVRYGSRRGRVAVRGNRADDRLVEQPARRRDGADRAHARWRRHLRDAGRRRAQHRQLRLDRRRPRHHRRTGARHPERPRVRERHQRCVRHRHADRDRHGAGRGRQLARGNVDDDRLVEQPARRRNGADRAEPRRRQRVRDGRPRRANTGSFAWTVTGPATAAALVRVTVSGGASATGVSGTFAIANATLAVTAPAASASWTIGTARTITWTGNLPPSGTVRIELSRDNGVSYTALTTSAPNNGSFAWTATGAATTSAFVRVSANGTPAASAVSGKFSLVAATLTVTSPNTLVTWLVGSVHAITWTHNVGAGATFKIEVSRNSGSTWSQITAAAPGSTTSGSYNWAVASPRSDTSRIRVTWTGNTAVKDTSNVNFRIR